VSVNVTELKRIVSYIFISKGVKALPLNEALYVISLDCGWFTPEEANKVVNLALERGLIEFDGALVKILFDHDLYSVPIGFKPTCASLEKSLFNEIIEWLTTKGLKKSDIVEMVNSKVVELGGLVYGEVALLLVARDLGYNVRTFSEDVYIEILHQR
jgi:hypothetical protein